MKTRDDLLSSLPDKTYFVKVLKRQKGYLILGILMTLAISAAAFLLVKDKYTSKVHAVYDRTDTTSMSTGFNSVLKYQTLGTLFEIKLQSPSFLGRVGQLSGGMKIMQNASGEGLVSEAKTLLKEYKDKYLGQELTEEQKLEIYANFLKTNVVPVNDPVSGIMNITVYGTTAENAQNIAAQAMELFIREELSTDVNALDLKLDFLRQKAMGLKTEAEKGAKKDKKTNISEPVNKLTPAERLKLSQQEAQLEDQIRRKRNELDRTTTDNSTRRITLETELNRMKTMLQPNHPNVKAKEEELKKLNQTNSSTKRISAQIQALKRKLWQVKARQIGSSAEGSLFDGNLNRAQLTPEGSFLLSVTEKIQDLQSERADLFRQIESPELRTRLKVVSPASYEPDPSKPKSLITALGILILGFMVSFAHMFFREFYCSLARDDWRVQRATGLPVLSQITDASMKGFPRITPKQADSLRSQLTTRSHPTTAARTLLAYRQVELALKRNSKGGVQFFVNPGSQDQTSGFFYNLMNIFTTDFNQNCLIIDCNINDPIVQLSSQGGETFWSDPTNEDKALVVYGDKDKAFDIIPPPQKLTGESSRVFNPTSLGKIIERLKTNYSRILIRGFPETFFVENQAFSDVATDCILCVDAKNTTFFELERCIAQLDSDQIRGIILIGT